MEFKAESTYIKRTNHVIFPAIDLERVQKGLNTLLSENKLDDCIGQLYDLVVEDSFVLDQLNSFQAGLRSEEQSIDQHIFSQRQYDVSPDRLIHTLREIIDNLKENDLKSHQVLNEVIFPKRKQVPNERQDKVGNIPIEMIAVKGATFNLGANDFKLGDSGVTLGDYYIGKYPVTQELWWAVMGNNPAQFKDNLKNPVENVSWNDTWEFIRKLNQNTGKDYRLPTEVEWEFAARGGSLSRAFEFSGSNDLDEVGWYNKNTRKKTQPVGKKKPNELNIYDMSGNVWEWCNDWYDSYNPNVRENLQQSKGSASRVWRGGSWHSSAERCRVMVRHYSYPEARGNACGFRLAHSE